MRLTVLGGGGVRPSAGGACGGFLAGRLLLAHLQPGTDPAASPAVAATEFGGEVAVASPGTMDDLRAPFRPA